MDNRLLNRIKVMMAERMISNKELGKLLGKDPATVSKWVTNTSQPSLENLIEIAKVLKCDIGDLVRKDETIVTNKTEEQI
jgi:DNA-binding Xre family transcriptional regulator